MILSLCKAPACMLTRLEQLVTCPLTSDIRSIWRLQPNLALSKALDEKGSRRVRVARQRCVGDLPTSGKFLVHQGLDHWDLLDADGPSSTL